MCQMSQYDIFMGHCAAQPCSAGEQMNANRYAFMEGLSTVYQDGHLLILQFPKVDGHIFLAISPPPGRG